MKTISSFITDRNGYASQPPIAIGVQYLPFGEPNRPLAVSSRIPLNYNTFYEQLFVEQRSTANYNTPYKFSGKEKDEETSYSYFGARYYMSDVSVWLSVDPMREKYPSLSPYNYCALNPIIITDPDGMDIDPTNEAWGVMNEAFKATLGEKNPFTFNEKTGKVDYDNNKIQGDFNPVQQEVVDHYKSLVDDHDYQVNVSVVEDDEKFIDENGNPTTLLKNNANGLAVPSKDGKTTDVYLSKKPRFSENGRTRDYSQQTDMKSIISIHEIGGHAYYSQQKSANNNYKTTDFEMGVRSIFKGKYIKDYIKNQPPINH